MVQISRFSHIVVLVLDVYIVSTVIVTIIIALLLAPFILLTACFAIELFAGLSPLPTTIPSTLSHYRAVIIVPAHNEAAVIRANLERLKAAAEGTATILLIADNCSDGTAQIAKEIDVEVIERSDDHLRGKGFALDFAREHLACNPPDVVLIVDADCSIDRPSIARLVKACAVSGRPCQAINLQQPGPEASPGVQLSTFAFFIKNVIRQRALKRIANRVHLLGTGMAFPWTVFVSAELATGNIVEDLRLGQELASLGHAPLLIEDASVWSNAETDANTISQRRRWEGGFLQNAVRWGPRMTGIAIRRADPRLLWAAINTMIPPLALLISLDIVMLLATGMLTWIFAARPWPLLVLCGALLSASLGLALAWRRDGSKFVSARSLLRVPIYIAWKIPMYLQLAKRGAPKEWQRTNRT